MNAIDQIAGADLVIQRFNRWPQFHDAEVIHVTFDRRGDAVPRIEVFTLGR